MCHLANNIGIKRRDWECSSKKVYSTDTLTCRLFQIICWQSSTIEKEFRKFLSSNRSTAAAAAASEPSWRPRRCRHRRRRRWRRRRGRPSSRSGPIDRPGFESRSLMKIGLWLKPTRPKVNLNSGKNYKKQKSGRLNIFHFIDHFTLKHFLCGSFSMIFESAWIWQN